jgi:hypothetical protein
VRPTRRAPPVTSAIFAVSSMGISIVAVPAASN